ncbi:hypothetical protein [Parvularcula sp. LCG005]|uniref:hypothetical protein n=1 Tax=Parvularcula sp. LCG005 TaxID=3078805 RepID=UPI0029432C66|nr:hypothetical protein [Parvularcula sp. LCG005]WOI54299.1 hypothetical protein RUI03_04685 [Parvularcula sp. LCG005]
MPKIRTAPRRRDRVLENEIYPTERRAEASMRAQSFEESIGPTAVRRLRRDSREWREFADFQTGARDDLPVLSAAAAQEQYGLDGALTFDAPVYESTAQELAEIKRREQRRQDILYRNAVGPDAAGNLDRLASGFTGAMADPVNIAATFIPQTWLARAGFLAKGGIATRTAARFAGGAAEAATVTAASEAFLLPALQGEQRDYDLGDSLANIFFSTVLGGTFTAGAGLVGDALSRPRSRPDGGDGSADAPPGTDVARQGERRPDASVYADEVLDAPDIIDRPIDIEDPLDADFSVRERIGDEGAGRRLLREESRELVPAGPDGQRAIVPYDEVAAAQRIKMKAAIIRQRAFVEAMDQMLDGEPVDVADVIRRAIDDEGVTPDRPAPGRDSRETPYGDLPPRPPKEDPVSFAEQVEAETGGAVRFGEGEVTEQLDAMRARLAEDDAMIADEIAGGRLSDEDVAAAEAEVDARYGGASRFDEKALSAAYDAARACILRGGV